MAEIKTPIPKIFTDEIYKALEDFDKLILFRWDLLTDTLSLRTGANTIPFDLPPQNSYISTEFLMGDYLHPADILFLENYLNHIFSETTHRANGSERYATDFRLHSADKKSYLWTELKIITYFDENRPQAVFGSLRNIHMQKMHQLALLHEAEHDNLTGFLNKRAVQHRISEYLHNLTPNTTSPALLILDADGFKNINDNFGHLFGDAVLTDMAMEIEKEFRHTDIIGRIGGDEFIVLFRELPSLDLLRHRCQQLIERLHRSYKNGTDSLPFSISIGIALYPQHGKTFDELFKHADRALYASKSKGKSTYSIYKPSLLSSTTHFSSRDPQHTADLQQKAFKDNMIEFIFRLLYETKNPEATIAVSLSMLGKQFNFDRVAISTYNSLNNSYKTSFEWTSPFGIARDGSNIDPYFSIFSEKCNHVILSRYKATQWGELSICEDIRTLSSIEAEAFEHFHIRSFAYNKITRGSEELGSICFETSNHAHKYTKDEFTYLNIFSSLLGNVLLTKQTDTLLSQQNKRLMDIINHMQEMIYIVDKETFELLFFNQTIRQALPEVSVPQACYYRFHGFSEPCPNCPVKDLSDNGAEYIVRTVDSWGFPTNTKAFNIDWMSDHHTSLIIMEP